MSTRKDRVVPELAALIELMCHGTATHADRDRLEKLLQDPANRAHYLAATRLHTELSWRWHRGRVVILDASCRTGSTARENSPSLCHSGRHSQRHRIAASVERTSDVLVSWLRFLSRPAPFACLFATAVLGAFLAAAGVMDMTWFGNPTFAEVARRTPPVAGRVTGLHAVRWRSPQNRHRVWEPVLQDGRIDVAAGLVQLTHQGGATVVIEGPASYQLLGPASGRLVRGRITVRTEHGDRSEDLREDAAPLTPLFTVHTPKRLVHDLGTEFGVQVDEGGDTGVYVFEGLVELATADRNAPARTSAIRLAVGESAGIDEAGRIEQDNVLLASRFIRNLPKATASSLKSFLDRIGWSDEAAETIYRDSFAATGPLAGTSPASRGGVGAPAWAAPVAWTRTADEQALMAEGPGTALLPFRPEPGWLYRISIDCEVIAGGDDWFALGLAPAIKPVESLYSTSGAHAWVGQRHSGREGNFAIAGPGTTGLLRPIDFATGRQRRSIFLDTSDSTWVAYFLLGDQPVAQASYPETLASMRCVALSQWGAARTKLRRFSVERVRADASRPAAGSVEPRP